jgi:hypothetical protein
MGTELFPGVNRPAEVALTTHPKESVEIYPYYPSWGPPRLLYNGYGVIPGLKSAGGGGVNHLPKRKRRDLSLLPLWTCWAGLHFNVSHDSVKSDTDSCHLTGEDTPYNLG